MNKKAILKELVKDPEIKNLLNTGFSRSIVNKLIIEELLKEDEPSAEPDIKAVAQKLEKWLLDNKTVSEQVPKLIEILKRFK